MSDEKVMLKYKHSYAVSKLMEELAVKLNLSCEDVEIAKVIGLLHDIGRFEQLKKFNSFDDKNVDHADESCNYLFKKGHIRDFVEDSKYDSILENSIRYHNKLSIPHLDERSMLFMKMIRDMDKVDIYKQSAIHYDMKFDASNTSEEVLKCFKEEKVVLKSMVKSKSDSIVLRLAFLFDINFDESLDILVETDNFDLFLSVIEVDASSEKLWKKLRELCFDKINRKIDKKEG